MLLAGVIVRSIAPKIPGAIGWTVGEFMQSKNQLLDYYKADNASLRLKLETTEKKLDIQEALTSAQNVQIASMQTEMKGLHTQINELKLLIGFRKEAEQDEVELNEASQTHTQ